VTEQLSTRRLRVVKYRGSSHGTNEYPFLIDETGFSVLPITSLTLDHEAPTERMPTGIPRLDQMLGGQGLFRGASVLVSGTPGTGKSSLAAHIIQAACARGERCLYFPFEESQSQIIRNMSSIGLDLVRWVERDVLRFHASRPHLQGLETHLALMHKQVAQFDPALVVIDPVSNLTDIGSPMEAKGMLTRMVDFLKSRGITAVFTSLTSYVENPEATEVGISSLMDTWLLLRNLESNGERNRGLHIIKSRGMGHSNQIRELVLSNQGADLVQVYTGLGGVLTGTARLLQEEQEKAETRAHLNNIERTRRELATKREAMEATIAAMRTKFEVEASELELAIREGERAEKALESQRHMVSGLRDAVINGGTSGGKGIRHGRGGKRQPGNGRQGRPRNAN
jgi:circadian clock protein KaiC